MVLDLSVSVRSEKGIPVIDISGEIDVYTYPRLSETLNEVLLGKGITDVILNLKDVKYIDSTGLGVIANGANKLAQKQGFVTIIHANPQVKKILEVSGLFKANFKLFDDETRALLDISNK